MIVTKACGEITPDKNTYHTLYLVKQVGTKGHSWTADRSQATLYGPSEAWNMANEFDGGMEPDEFD